MKKWMIITIIIIYSTLIGLLIYFHIDNNKRKDKLITQVEILEKNLKIYYEEVYDAEDLGKLFIFPGETNIEFDDDGIIGGSAYIYSDGRIEIALYNGKYCAYKLNELEVKKTSISECVINRGN